MICLDPLCPPPYADGMAGGRSCFPFLVLLATAVNHAIADPGTPERSPSANWFQIHLEQRQSLRRGGHEICLFGDSLFAFWQGEGRGSWELDLAPFRPFNASVAGDRVEHLHFRIQHADFGDSPPRQFVLLIGTNNLARPTPDPPDAVAAGIFSTLSTLRRKAPDSRVLLLSILPSGFEPKSDLRSRIQSTNRLLSAGAEAAQVTYLDVHGRFLSQDGKWKPGLSTDGTHLTARGYDVLAAPIVAHLAGENEATESSR